MRIFITGGAGFIASHLVERLVDDNQVVVYDNFARNSLFLAGDLASHTNLSIIRGSVLDHQCLRDAIEGAEIVIHCAAIAGIYSVGSSPAMTMEVNLIGSYNVVKAAAEVGVGRVIDFSTSEVYGPFVYKGKETDNTTTGPIGERRWVYAVSKLASEHLMHSYGGEHHIGVTSVRPFNIYGPRQIGEGAIQQMVTKALGGEDIVVYNDGTQVRSWCYIGDFVDAILRILKSKESIGEVFNIGNPRASMTTLGLAQRVAGLCGSSSKIVFRGHPGAEVEVRIPDISKACKILGYEPIVDIEEGLQRTIEWYRGRG